MNGSDDEIVAVVVPAGVADPDWHGLTLPTVHTGEWQHALHSQTTRSE